MEMTLCVLWQRKISFSRSIVCDIMPRTAPCSTAGDPSYRPVLLTRSSRTWRTIVTTGRDRLASSSSCWGRGLVSRRHGVHQELPRDVHVRGHWVQLDLQPLRRHATLQRLDEKPFHVLLVPSLAPLKRSVITEAEIMCCCFHMSFCCTFMPSVLWCCWLGGRKGIWPVKTEWWGTSVVICLEQGANDFAYGPADATATPSFLAPVKSRMGYLSGAGLPRLSGKKGR